MVDPRTLRRWLYRFAFFGLSAILIFMAILPISVEAGRLPGPDLLVCFTFAWVLRRPRFVPVPLIALIFLSADMLYMRPPGLWTALMIIAVEVLRTREHTVRESSFPMEWVLVAATLTAIFVVNRTILSVLLVEQVPLGPALIQMIATLVVYPLVVLITHWAFGVRRLIPGEAEALEDAA